MQRNTESVVIYTLMIVPFLPNGLVSHDFHTRVSGTVD